MNNYRELYVESLPLTLSLLRVSFIRAPRRFYHKQYLSFSLVSASYDKTNAVS